MVFNATFNNISVTFNNISVTLCWGSKEKNRHKYNKSNYNGVPFKMRNFFVLKSHLVPSCRNVNRIKQPNTIERQSVLFGIGRI